MNQLAGGYLTAGKPDLALPLWTEQSALDPQDSLLLLKVASLQVWFRKDKEYTETVSRAIRSADELLALDAALEKLAARAWLPVEMAAD